MDEEPVRIESAAIIEGVPGGGANMRKMSRAELLEVYPRMDEELPPLFAVSPRPDPPLPSPHHGPPAAPQQTLTRAGGGKADADGKPEEAHPAWSLRAPGGASSGWGCRG